MTTNPLEATLLEALDGDGYNVAGRAPSDLTDRLPFHILRRAPASSHVDAGTRHLERVRLTLHTYAGTEAEAFTAAADVVDNITALEGLELNDTVVITAVTVTASPYPLHDPDQPDLGRYLTTLTIHAHRAL